MMGEWREIVLSRIISFRNGKKRPISKGKNPVYGGNGILGYTNEFNYHDVIIIGRVGAYCGSVYYNSNNCWVSDNAIAAQNKDNANMQYCYYLLNSLQLNKRHIGTSQPLLTQEILNSIYVTVPALNQQKKIAAILTVLDDKIELNAQINRNLETQARAIFKSWFIDFEPFRDGEFVDSEFGPIPKGWRVGTLSDVANITMGQSPSGKSYNEMGEGIIFYQGRAEFGDRFPQRRLYTTNPLRMARAKDILISVRAPVGDINVAVEDCCIGRGLAAISPKNNDYSFLLYSLFNLKAELDVFNGTGTVFGSINKNALNVMKIIIPPHEIVARFEMHVNPLDRNYHILCMENCNLAKLRDTLLPKLMSGEIDVSAVEV